MGAVSGARITGQKGEHRMPDPCKAPNKVVPVIDRSRCEGKAPCVEVCPYKVFEIRSLEASDKAALAPMSRFKAWVHGNKQAYVVQPDACHACGLCVPACPEKAIRLVPVARATTGV